MSIHNYFLLAISVIIIVLLIIMTKQKLIKKIWLKRLINITLIISCVIMISAVVLFPGLSNIKTTGIYSYESSILELEDTSRIEYFKNDGSHRKLSVLIHYPDDFLKNNSCPLIVFSHGGISTKTSNISLYEELASHGYVVVSIDHTYHALSTVIDGQTIYQF